MKAAWTTKPFTDVVSSRGSGAGGLAQKQWAETGLFPVVGQGEGEIEGWTDRDDLLLTPEPAWVLYGGHTRRAKHVDYPFVPGPNVRILTPCPDVDARFLFYFLTHLQIPSKGYADHFPLVRKCEVRFPALPEQRRIAAILDEAFEGIAAAKANAERNLRNAGSVFSARLQSVFSEHRLGWRKKPLKEVCVFENGDRGKNYPNRNEYVDSGIPWINTGHIQSDGTLSASDMHYISRAKYDSLRSGKIRPGDLVYCLRGATLGKTALVEPYTVGAIASSLVILRPTPSLKSRFLYYFLRSPVGQGFIKGYENGAAQPNLGAKSVAKYLIPMPPVTEQQLLVEMLDEVSDETNRLTGVFNQKRTALDELKASLLHQAFTGQL